MVEKVKKIIFVILIFLILVKFDFTENRWPIIRPRIDYNVSSHNVTLHFLRITQPYWFKLEYGIKGDKRIAAAFQFSVPNNSNGTLTKTFKIPNWAKKFRAIIFCNAKTEYWG
mgnify:CR=1 FL=1